MPPRDRLDADQRLLWNAYRDVSNGLSTALQAQLLRDAGLSESEYTVLVALGHDPRHVMRARELCTELAWDRSRLSHLVARMEQRGLVAREECVNDARGSMVRLTEAGRVAVEDAAPEHADAIRRYFFDVLSRDDLAALERILARLHASLADNET